MYFLHEQFINIQKDVNKMKKVICDCDNTMGFPGRPMDDALAILYLVGCSEDIDLVGITSNFGNGTSDESFFSNTVMLNEIGLSDIPVLKGNELGEDAVSEAAQFIVDKANEYPGELIYLGIGSLGNLYGAFLIDNEIFDKISQIVLMGGITEPLLIHDGKPLDELNFSVFAKASSEVLQRGRNISIITGNNCLPVSELPKDAFLDILCSSDNPAGMYIAQKCGYRFKTKELVYGADSSYCWDVVAAAYINHPEKFTDHPTPCFINEAEIAASGYLHPCSESESNNIINIPTARNRHELQEIFYSSWLAVDMNTNYANFSCKGLYLDKLIQPCILIELSKEPCHGFLLMQKLRKDGYIDSNLDPTGFYRNLRKMENEGYLTSTSDGKSSKSRRTYTISDLGKRALKDWEGSLKKYERHVRRIVNGINSVNS